MHTDDHRVVRNERGCFVQQNFCALPVAREHGGLRSKVDGVSVGRIFGSPKLDLMAREIVLALPHVRLHDTVADGFARIEGAAALVHRECVIEQTDVREDGAEAIVGVGQVALESESALEFSDGFEMLKVFGRAPKQKCAGNMGFGEIRVKFQRAAAMEFGLFEPGPARREFEMKDGADIGENGVAERVGRVTSDGIRQMLGGFFQ